ncbi:MAG: Ig domain-containing protein [Nitrospira sp.]|nr:Ig domain-containing protein [Nitrospira sp.]
MDQHVTRQRILWKAGGEGSLSALVDIPAMYFVLLMALITFSGCSRHDDRTPTPVSQQATGQLSSPGIRQVSIAPNPIIRTTSLTVSIEKDGAHGETSSYRYQWFLNKIAVQGATGPYFDSSALRRGDMIHVVVTVPDATGGGASYQSSPVAVPNVLPVIKSVALEQDFTLGGRRLLAKVDAFDADQDDIHFEFRWLRNDKVVSEGPDNVFDITDVAQNDIVTVEATPHDRDGGGIPVRARPLVSGNNPPKILSTPLMMANAESYEYAVEAKDPEGDVVAFELETAPSGMSIDRSTGHLTWKPSPAIQGTHHVKVVALDGKGGRTWQEFDLSVPTSMQAPQEISHSGNGS